MQEQVVSISQPSAMRAIVLAAILFVLDAFLLNQGMIALAIGAWLLVVSVPRALLATKYAGARMQRLRNIAIYFSAVILVFVCNAANNSLAHSRAETLISAVEAFHAKNQRYPKSLQELVPAYIEQVPAAKYTVISSQFWYAGSDGGATLWYVAVPPFGRPTYSFASKKWGYID